MQPLLPPLPMEVWARVATFLSFDTLLYTFWALEGARLLPPTETNASNAFLQFCSEVGASPQEEETDVVYDVSFETRLMLREMGVDATLIDRAVRLCRGREEGVWDYILTHLDRHPS